MARIITVTSGKGGVGKTNLSVNMALYLASQGFRTCVFDADLGLANISILLGIAPEYDLDDVISKRKRIEEIIIKDCHGIDIIPGCSGVSRMADLEPENLSDLLDSLSRLDEYDFLIFDTSAGISKNVISFCMASSELILVVTPEPTSLVDGYSLLKVLSLNGYDQPVNVTVNQAKSVKVADVVFNKLKSTVEKYLPIRLTPFGTVLHDPSVARAVNKQQPFISLYPNSTASKCIKNMARHLLRKKNVKYANTSLAMFWSKFLGILKSPIKISSSPSGPSHGKSMADDHATKETTPPEPSNANAAPSETQPEESPARHSPAAEIAQKDAGSPNIQLLLKKLVENTSMISQELVEIRSVLTRDG
jgi:flagellar biosynthesis protein FlhG